MSKLQFDNGKMISSSKYGQEEDEAASLELTPAEREMERAIKVTQQNLFLSIKNLYSTIVDSYSKVLLIQTEQRKVVLSSG